MCDFSLQTVKSRPAVVGDKLVSTNFGTGTGGLASPADMGTAVCVLPGTELAFDADVVISIAGSERYSMTIEHRVARFRQVDRDRPNRHHDALEFPDGTIALLHNLLTGQRATILQLPAAPKTAEEAKEQERLPVTA